MIFCGQCGLQLAPGIAKCPRCGAIVDQGVQGGEFHADDATVTSLPYYPNNPSQPAAQRPTGQFTPPNPQKLVLRSDPNNQDYGMEGAILIRDKVPPIQAMRLKVEVISHHKGLPTQATCHQEV